VTDRHSGYIVVLADDIREDDAEEGVLNAIRMIKGVVSVKPVLAGGQQQYALAHRRDVAWRDALADLARNGPGGGSERQ
jgi:hypothetical protein